MRMQLYIFFGRINGGFKFHQIASLLFLEGLPNSKNETPVGHQALSFRASRSVSLVCQDTRYSAKQLPPNWVLLTVHNGNNPTSVVDHQLLLAIFAAKKSVCAKLKRLGRQLLSCPCFTGMPWKVSRYSSLARAKRWSVCGNKLHDGGEIAEAVWDAQRSWGNHWHHRNNWNWEWFPANNS